MTRCALPAILAALALHCTRSEPSAVSPDAALKDAASKPEQIPAELTYPRFGLRLPVHPNWTVSQKKQAHGDITELGRAVRNGPAPATALPVPRVVLTVEPAQGDTLAAAMRRSLDGLAAFEAQVEVLSRKVGTYRIQGRNLGDLYLRYRSTKAGPEFVQNSKFILMKPRKLPAELVTISASYPGSAEAMVASELKQMLDGFRIETQFSTSAKENR